MSIRALILFIVAMMAMMMGDGVISSSLRGNSEEECMYDTYYGFKYISTIKFESTFKNPAYKDHSTHNVSIPGIYGLNKGLHAAPGLSTQTYGVDVIGFIVKKYIIKGMFEGSYNNETKIIISMAYRKECQGIPTDLDIKNEVNKQFLNMHKDSNYIPLFKMEYLNITWVSETKIINETSKYFNFK